MWLSLLRCAHSSGRLAVVSRVGAGAFSQGGSRLSGAHTRLKHVQQLHGWRAIPFQHVALACAPRTFVPNVCNSFVDGGRLLFLN
eukprot:4469757-Pyramimonas_sp.AAC.1